MNRACVYAHAVFRGVDAITTIIKKSVQYTVCCFANEYCPITYHCAVKVFAIELTIIYYSAKIVKVIATVISECYSRPI